jgi:hypothetical protein
MSRERHRLGEGAPFTQSVSDSPCARSGVAAGGAMRWVGETGGVVERA